MRHAGPAALCLLVTNAVRVDDLTALVREQRKTNFSLLGECAQNGRRIVADPYQLRAGRFDSLDVLLQLN